MHEKGAWWELEQLILMEKMRAKIDARYKERRKMADCNPDIRLKPGTATYTDLRRSTKGSQREQVKADKDKMCIRDSKKTDPNKGRCMSNTFSVGSW